MQDMGGRPVVELKINGRGPYRFLLDTGAVTTVISDELGRELSLSPPAGVQVAAVGGGTRPAIVVIHDLRIGDAVLQDTIAAVMPLGGLLQGEDAPRGVLSAASFPGYLLTCDYPGKLVSIKKGALDRPIPRALFSTLKTRSSPRCRSELPVTTPKSTLTRAPPLASLFPSNSLASFRWPHSRNKPARFVRAEANFRFPSHA
jgi:hypothetical protein